MNRHGQFFIITAVLIAGALITITTILTASETINYNAVLERHDTDIMENVAHISGSEWWDQDWQFRKRVVVEEEAGQFLTGEAVTLYLDARNERVENDCDDIRTVVDGQEVAWVNTTPCDIDTYDTDVSAVARWPMDENTGTTVDDSTDGGHDGTLQGDAGWTSGRFGSGLTFDGNGDYVDVTEQSDIPDGSEDYAITAWFRADGDCSCGILGWGNYGTANETTALRLHNSGNADEISLRHYWWGNDIDATTTVPYGGVWHLVVAQFNGTHRQIWLDGEKVAEDTPGSGHNAQVQDVTIGTTNTNEYFDGSIDDPRIYASALSPGQIDGIYNNGIGLNVSLDMLPRERLSDVAVYYGNPSAADPGHTAADLNVTALSQRPTVVQVGPMRSQQEIAQKMSMYVDRFDELISPSISLQRREGRCDLLTLQSTTAVLDREIC